MKYFTADIWAGWQSDDARVVSRSVRRWKSNLAAYNLKDLVS